MKFLNLTLIVSSLLATAMLSPQVLAASEIVVVANLPAPVSMQKHEIRNLFMGGASSEFEPVTLKPGIHERLIFNARVVGLTESRIQSYWAQMRFSGRSKAPVQVSSVEAMKQYLLENKGSVGYLPADSNVPDTLTVLYTSG